MTWLILGLAIFIGTHSIRIIADDWRNARVASLGEWPWKAVHALISVIGFALFVRGYSLSGQEVVQLWLPPQGMRHATALFTLPAFILAVAAYLPGNRLKAWLGHPLLLGVCLWAFGHLLSNGKLHSMILFGVFLAWGIVDFVSARRRGALPVAKPGILRDVVMVIVGIVAWAGFARYGHGLLIGVPLLG